MDKFYTQIKTSQFNTLHEITEWMNLELANTKNVVNSRITPYTVPEKSLRYIGFIIFKVYLENSWN